MTKPLILGTRASALARWQTAYVEALLRQAWPDLEIETRLISTQGDRVVDTPLPLIGGKGVFTAELEAALHNGQIDFAVHSLKDLPTESPAGLTIGAVPPRAPVGDVLISRQGHTLANLPQGATVGTSSRRRAAQIRHRRPDLRMIDIRGNIDTRLRKALDPTGDYDAIVLAHAGLDRLGLTAHITEILALDVMLPAPGQGALGIQCRDDDESPAFLAPLNHAPAQWAVTAERAFLAALGGGCSLPIAAYAEIEDDMLTVRGRVTAPDGQTQIDVETRGVASLESAQALGAALAEIAFARGAAGLLEDLS
jgi:hydroxymethylbilane synthase